jgi:sugar lactone lactonase YvrE
MAKEIASEPFLTDLGHKDLCSPFFDGNNTLHVCFQNSGEVWRVSPSGQLTRFHSTQGQAAGGCFDAEGCLYVADFAHSAVLKSAGDGEQEMVVGVYEDRPLKGPHCVISHGLSIIFTDSGPRGETGLHSPTGSVFMIKGSPPLLVPISMNNLAYPTGVATFGGFIYVAEQCNNRVLRFWQEPAGVYNSSVFYQNSGGVGPSCIAIDHKGTLYVGIYETSLSGKSTGKVLVISDSGQLVSVVTTAGPEVTGVAINASTKTLYVTERSTGTIFEVAL